MDWLPSFTASYMDSFLPLVGILPFLQKDLVINQLQLKNQQHQLLGFSIMAYRPYLPFLPCRPCLPSCPWQLKDFQVTSFISSFLGLKAYL
jgi:hypothetical protein